MNRFPDFNKWHKVPDGVTVPSGVPVWIEYYRMVYGFLPNIPPDEELYGVTAIYTEQPITDPLAAERWERAEKMYRTAHPSLDDAWEYQTQDTKDRWYALAKKYVEKED